MAATIKLGIVGYGNLGKGVEKAISQNSDLELVAVFSRRSGIQLQSTARALSMEDLDKYTDEIDVLLLCGGSANDLPKQGVHISKLFNTVDSFDNHAKIPDYFQAVNQSASAHQHLSLISTGWDPGLFSMMRLIGEAVLPKGKTYTFWGKGLSQGHSDAIRRIPGVKMGAQYTLPDEKALTEVRNGKQPNFKAPEMHNRVCYVVLEKDADAKVVENAIKTMPDYFAPYHTEVYFITEEIFKADHQAMPHGGRVLRAGESTTGNKQVVEFSLGLESNPEFTSSVLVAFARAVHRMRQEGNTGAITPFDIPLGKLSPKSPKELRKELL